MSQSKPRNMSDLQYIRGIPFTNAPRFPRKNIEAAFDFVAKDGDIVITSYPKTGTTLLEYIVLQIISKGKLFPNVNELFQEIVPFIEMTGISAIETRKDIKAYKTHIPFNIMKKNDKAKYLYVYRRPEDALISSYHFTQETCNKQILLEDFFEDYIAGNIAWGQYFKHVSACMAHKNDPNLLITTYEKLTSDRREEILRIAKFLGDEYHQSVAGNESVLNAIMGHTTFDYMKSRLWYDIADVRNCSERRKINFFRKGVVGEGRCVLSSDQMKRLRDVMQEQIDDKHLLEEWCM